MAGSVPPEMPRRAVEAVLLEVVEQLRDEPGYCEVGRRTVLPTLTTPGVICPPDNGISVMKPWSRTTAAQAALVRYARTAWPRGA